MKTSRKACRILSGKGKAIMADNRKERERAELHRMIWNIANDLRGSVDGWDFKLKCPGYAVLPIHIRKYHRLY